MSRVKNILHKCIYIIPVVFALSFLLAKISSDTKATNLLGFVSNFMAVGWVVILYASIIIRDFGNSNFKLTRIIFYSLAAITFLSLLIIRYNNILNGYLIFIPFIICTITLLILSLVPYVKRKGLLKEWALCCLMIILSIVVVKFF